MCIAFIIVIAFVLVTVDWVSVTRENRKLPTYSVTVTISRQDARRGRVMTARTFFMRSTDPAAVYFIAARQYPVADSIVVSEIDVVG